MSHDIEALNLLDLDLEMVERRLEMSSMVHPMGYVCIGDLSGGTCAAHIPVK